MFERYTEKARRVIFFGRYHASRCGSPYIDPEHLLLGVMQEDRELALSLLQSEDRIAAVQRKLEVRSNPQPASSSVDLPLSHASKRALAYGAEEAERMRHHHIATGHLLLGLVREQDSLAAQALREEGVRLEEVRHWMAESPAAEVPRPGPQPAPAPSREHLLNLLEQVPEQRWHQAARLLHALAADRISVAVAGSRGAFSFSFEGGDTPSSSASSAGDDFLARVDERVRRVTFFARYEASQLGSPSIDPQHLLLGLMREDKTLAHRFRLPVEAIRKEVEAQSPPRQVPASSLLPFSEASHAAIELAGEEADTAGQKQIAMEHLLLGLLRQPDSPAAQILNRHGVDLEAARRTLRGD